MSEELNLEELLEDLNGDDETDRIYAADDLGELNDPESIEPLCDRFVIEESNAVKEAIVIALENIDSPFVVEKCSEWLYSNVAFSRNMAVRLLQKVGERNLPYLSSLYMSETDPDVRKFIIDAAAKFDRSNCLEFIRAGLQDDDVNILIASVEYAGQRQLHELEPETLTVLEYSDNPMLITSCLEALACYGQPSSFEHIKRKFPEIGPQQLVYFPSIVWFYGKFGKSTDLPFLEQLLEACPGQIDSVLTDGILEILDREPELEITPTIAAWIETLIEHSANNTALRRTIAFLASRATEDNASALLSLALNNQNKRVRLRAVEVLANDDTCASQLENRIKTETDPEVKEALYNAVC